MSFLVQSAVILTSRKALAIYVMLHAVNVQSWPQIALLARLDAFSINLLVFCNVQLNCTSPTL